MKKLTITIENTESGTSTPIKITGDGRAPRLVSVFLMDVQAAVADIVAKSAEEIGLQ